MAKRDFWATILHFINFVEGSVILLFLAKWWFFRHLNTHLDLSEAIYVLVLTWTWSLEVSSLSPDRFTESKKLVCEFFELTCSLVSPISLLARPRFCRRRLQ